MLFLEGSIPSSFLLESFLLYVSQEERETVPIALGDKFDPNDGDLLDFLRNFKCFSKVTAGNISRVVHEFKLTRNSCRSPGTLLIVLYQYFQC